MKNDSARSYSILPLPDGRNLGYAEYGVANGSPVLFFHGAPGSSHIHADMADVAAQLKIRLIAVDRPGYGSSYPHAARTLLSWAADIAALTDALALPRFSIIGFSGGTPYALACAFSLPERVTKVALVGALAPLDIPGVTEGLSPLSSGLFELARTNPGELRNTFASVAPSAAALHGVIQSSASEWEKAVLNEHQSEFETEFTRTLQSGIEGVASDFILYTGDWKFPLEDIKTETHLWSGTDDCYTPPAMSRYLDSHLPNSRFFTLQGEGHYALYGHWQEILQHIS